jgi:ornithine cyclodeaminase/alanine dehydrogenase-like protein (mu-crystallin family)
MDWQKIIPVSRLLAEGAGKRLPESITVFKSLGCGLEDLAIASLFYDQVTTDC